MSSSEAIALEAPREDIPDILAAARVDGWVFFGENVAERGSFHLKIQRLTSTGP